MSVVSTLQMYKRIRKLFISHIPILMKAELLRKVPSLYRLLEIKPTSCTVIVTDRCNLKCVMCKQWRKPNSAELSAQEWRKIIDDIRKSNIKNIHFTGGEPLLRGDIKGLVAYSADRGFTVGLTTNGMMLKYGMLNDLLDAGLRSIALSMDALDAKYEKIRGRPNTFERLKAAALRISEAHKAKKVHGYINFTLMKDNIDECAQVMRFAEKVGLPVAICLLDRTSSIFDLEENKIKFWIASERDFEDLSRMLDFLWSEKIRSPSSLLSTFSMIKFIGDYFRDPRQEKIPCTASQDRIVIDPYGNLLGGCMSMGTFGNLKDAPFSKLKDGPRYISAKKAMFYKKCDGCSCGYQFNIKTLPSFIVRDMLEWCMALIFKK